MFSLENVPDSGMSLYNAEIHVEGGQLLQLTKLGTDIFAVAKYTGGTADNPAKMILGKAQQLYITGDIGGTTNVSINYSNFPDAATLDYIYISAPASADGNTLANAKLTKGTASVEGTIGWIGYDGNPLDNSTAVVKDKKYKWRFTPNDTGNYNVVEGTVVLYTLCVSDGGGGGGAPAAPDEKPQTEPVRS